MNTETKPGNRLGTARCPFGMIRQMVFTLVLAGAVLVPPSLKLAAATPTPKRFQIQAQSRTVSVPYLSNVDLDVGSEAITRAIIPIHGLGSDPNGIYNRVRNAAQKIPGMTEKALILAPQMLERGEISGTIDEDLVYWWWNPYWGSERVLVGPSEVSENLSSFTVLDQMIDHLLKASLFPNLEDIVIIGFSAGGQLVHRYAVSSPKETQARATRDIHFRYVVMSPSSYVYLDNKRAISGTTDTFAIFDGAGCGSFNSYGYGLNNLYSYHSENGMTPALMRQQYEKRFVFYLTGEADNNPNDSGLDKRCQALLEGAHRLERAAIFFNYVQDLYGPSILDRQNLQTVPGIGHSDALIESAQGMKQIFDYDTGDTDQDGFSDWKEWIWGTDANSGISQPTMQSEMNSETNTLNVSWQSQTDRSYRIWAASDMKTWNTASEWLQGTGKEMTFSVTLDDSVRFVRIQCRLR